MFKVVNPTPRRLALSRSLNEQGSSHVQHTITNSRSEMVIVLPGLNTTSEAGKNYASFIRFLTKCRVLDLTDPSAGGFVQDLPRAVKQKLGFNTERVYKFMRVITRFYVETKGLGIIYVIAISEGNLTANRGYRGMFTTFPKALNIVRHIGIAPANFVPRYVQAKFYLARNDWIRTVVSEHSIQKNMNRIHFLEPRTHKLEHGLITPTYTRHWVEDCLQIRNGVFQ